MLKLFMVLCVHFYTSKRLCVCVCVRACVCRSLPACIFARSCAYPLHEYIVRTEINWGYSASDMQIHNDVINLSCVRWESMLGYNNYREPCSRHLHTFFSSYVVSLFVISTELDLPMPWYREMLNNCRHSDDWFLGTVCEWYRRMREGWSLSIA